MEPNIKLYTLSNKKNTKKFQETYNKLLTSHVHYIGICKEDPSYNNGYTQGLSLSTPDTSIFMLEEDWSKEFCPNEEVYKKLKTAEKKFFENKNLETAYNLLSAFSLLNPEYGNVCLSINDEKTGNFYISLNRHPEDMNDMDGYNFSKEDAFVHVTIRDTDYRDIDDKYFDSVPKAYTFMLSEMKTFSEPEIEFTVNLEKNDLSVFELQKLQKNAFNENTQEYANKKYLKNFIKRNKIIVEFGSMYKVPLLRTFTDKHTSKVTYIGAARSKDLFIKDVENYISKYNANNTSLWQPNYMASKYSYRKTDIEEM